MKNETKKVLESFYEIDWFAKCGTCDDPSVSIVKTEAQAKKYYSARKWENFKNAISNRRAEKFWARIPYEREDEVNEVHRKLSEVADEFSGGNRDLLFKNYPEDPAISRMLKFDIRSILTDVEIRDEVQPIFGYPILYTWYKRGFMPCGWDGKMISQDWEGDSFEDLPRGKIRVF